MRARAVAGVSVPPCRACSFVGDVFVWRSGGRGLTALLVYIPYPHSSCQRVCCCAVCARTHTEIVQFQMSKQQYAKVIRSCRKFTEHDPQLWVEALIYFAAQPGACEAELTQVLDHIDRLGLLPPLMVVQILARNPSKPVSVVRDFLIRALQHESSVASADKQEIRKYQEETHRMRQEVGCGRPSTFYVSRVRPSCLVPFLLRASQPPWFL
jgi:hypothetical protein